MTGKYFLCKGMINKLYKSLMKEAKALSAKASSLQPQAEKNYAKAKAYEDACDFIIADCYRAYHCYDEVKSLSAFAKELRTKAKKLKAWADTFTWIKYPEGEKADCSKKQSDFIFRLTFEYKKLIDKYYPK